MTKPGLGDTHLPLYFQLVTSFRMRTIYAKYSIRKINKTVRQELRVFRKPQDGMVTDPAGPLWYRGLALEAEQTLETHLGRLLENYKVRRIVVAHTTTMGAILPRFNARLLLIDTGISRLYGGRPACLLIETDKVYALHRGTKLEIPSDSGAGLLRYLKRAAALDPSPSPLRSAIAKLEAKLAAEETLAIPTGRMERQLLLCQKEASCQID